MTPSLDDLKLAAARRAVEYVASGTTIGLGSGSTMRHRIALLGDRLASGALRGVLAVPTSEDTAAQCRALGIPLTTLDEHPHLELAIDGADEIGPRLDLIKGMGGALLREKLVAGVADRFVVVADASLIGKLKAMIKRACLVQIEGGGFSLVEALSNCPVGWGMTPQESLEHLKGPVVAEYPLGVIVDRGVVAAAGPATETGATPRPATETGGTPAATTVPAPDATAGPEG